MAEIRFYHVQRYGVDTALPRLLEKVLAAGFRAVVRAANPDRVEALDRALWTYDAASFLPHGTPDTGYPERQPIYLTHGTDVPNGAQVLVLLDGVAPPDDLSDFARCLLMFDGRDEAAIRAARQTWKALKARGDELSYWQQGEAGGWQQKA